MNIDIYTTASSENSGDGVSRMVRSQLVKPPANAALCRCRHDCLAGSVLVISLLKGKEVGRSPFAAYYSRVWLGEPLVWPSCLVPFLSPPP